MCAIKMEIEKNKYFVICGVSQGSNLGPLLFLICMFKFVQIALH